MNVLLMLHNDHLHVVIKENGAFPNNKLLPVLLYRAILELPEHNAAQKIELVFKENNWFNSWRNGIYPYHHYHSNTHEVLGVYAGHCDVALGGDDENIYRLEKADVLIIPAGVAHKNIRSSENFACVGAYPEGRSYDIKYGKPEERPDADENIRNVPIPSTDPVYGKGPLQVYWK